MRPIVKVRGEFTDNEYIRKSPYEDDVAIDYELCDRVDYVCGNTLLRDETFRYKQEELLNLSEAYRIAMNMDKKELAVFLCACVDKFPYLVYQALAEDHEALTNRRRY